MFHYKQNSRLIHKLLPQITLYPLKALFVLFAVFVLNFSVTNAQDTEGAKNDLRQLKAQIEDQINQYQNDIESIKKDKKSVEQNIAVLNKKIDKQKLQIKKINISLQEIEGDIKDKDKEIGGLEDKLSLRKKLLAKSIKRLNEYDNTSWLSILLNSDSISEFFNQTRYLQDIQSEIADFINNIDEIKNDLETQKSDLEDKKADIVNLKSLEGLEKKSLEKKQGDLSSVLSENKQKEKSLTENIKKSKKDIVLIKQQLFTLENVGVSISFEEAVNKAKFAGEKTNVRPAFILGIFQVESKLGTNIGGGSWKADMKPKERALFLQITSKLGLDPDTMPVSSRPCSKAKLTRIGPGKPCGYGWGGAMGPAQFIPSTWLGFEAQIASLTGKSAPSPWNLEDAFVASALKLASNGADSQVYQNEHSAAAKYLAGGRYKTQVAKGYADTVMDWADYYQDQIDTINSVSIAQDKNRM